MFTAVACIIDLMSIVRAALHSPELYWTSSRVPFEILMSVVFCYPIMRIGLQTAPLIEAMIKSQIIKEMLSPLLTPPVLLELPLLVNLGLLFALCVFSSV